MNKKELRKLLEKLDLYDGWVSLDGELVPDKIVLDQINTQWVVFYFDERGNKNDEMLYSSEDEACESILNLLLPYASSFYE